MQRLSKIPHKQLSSWWWWRCWWWLWWCWWWWWRHLGSLCIEFWHSGILFKLRFITIPLRHRRFELNTIQKSKSLRPIVKILIFLICFESNTVFSTNNNIWVKQFEWKVESWPMNFRIFYHLVFPASALMTVCTQAHMGSTSFCKNPMTHVIPAWFDSLPQSFLWCHKLLGFLSLKSQVAVKTLGRVWTHYPAAVWIFFHKNQTRGWIVSLKTGVVLLLGQGGATSM